MTGAPLAAIIVPILVSLCGGAFSYWQARKVADRNAEVARENTRIEQSKVDVSSFQALNEALREEIERLRNDRAEDQKRHAQELSGVSQKLATLEQECEKQKFSQARMRAWARTVVLALNDPSISALLSERRISIPAPPIEEDQ